METEPILDPVSLAKEDFSITRRRIRALGRQNLPVPQPLLERCALADLWLKQNDPTWNSELDADRDVLEEKGTIFQQRPSEK